MKSTITLLLLASSYALSSSITPDMVIKKESNLIFSKESFLQKEIRSNRGNREARECRFCLRKMPQTREIRMARLNREIFYFNSVERQNKKLAIMQ